MPSSVFLCYLYGLGSELMNCELCFLHILQSSRKSLIFTSQYLLMCFKNGCCDQQTSAVRKKSYFQLAEFERKVFLSKHEKDVIFYKWSLGRVFGCQHWAAKYSTRKQLLTLYSCLGVLERHTVSAYIRKKNLNLFYVSGVSPRLLWDLWRANGDFFLSVSYTNNLTCISFTFTRFLIIFSNCPQICHYCKESNTLLISNISHQILTIPNNLICSPY